ncbi:hypothetical protein P350_26510 [Burkholderia cepacia JBK9]|nr:hypothetical protein P350_26510 [Burkholderia cepacia JBK9]
MFIRSAVAWHHPRHHGTRLRDFRFEPIEKPPDLRLTFPPRPRHSATKRAPSSRTDGSIGVNAPHSTCQSISTEPAKSATIDG